WIVSLILIALIYKLRLDFLRNERLIILVILIEMLKFFLDRFIGISVNGAYGWISVAGVTIQPAEYLKIIIILYLDKRFSLKQEEISTYD
ncbi:FtsW/RodA/SpoVE family cell cycle protein, partial [Streptococcus pneumoniae]|nr:FtsW/RodA/SpoVE family cell cycle protein [Streptococcus pneumoniae]